MTPTFVQLHGNQVAGFPLLNLDHVRELREVPREKEKSGVPDPHTTYNAYDATGECLGRLSGAELPLKGHAIPNTTNVRLISFYKNADENNEITATKPQSIIGWHLPLEGEYLADSASGCGGVGIPLTFEDPGSVWCYLDDDTYIFPEDYTCGSLADAVARAKERYQWKEDAEARQRARVAAKEQET